MLSLLLMMIVSIRSIVSSRSWHLTLTLLLAHVGIAPGKQFTTDPNQLIRRALLLLSGLLLLLQLLLSSLLLLLTLCGLRLLIERIHFIAESRHGQIGILKFLQRATSWAATPLLLRTRRLLLIVVSSAMM
jgi:hypothetical protein